MEGGGVGCNRFETLERLEAQVVQSIDDSGDERVSASEDFLESRNAQLELVCFCFVDRANPTHLVFVGPALFLHARHFDVAVAHVEGQVSMSVERLHLLCLPIDSLASKSDD